MRILVADDETTLRTVISQVLVADGHEVVAVGSGEEALERFKADPFPLVVTDVVMGRMSGLELLSQVKAFDPDCLVVVMTSHASLETAMKALQAGAYDFLVKPFDEIELISAVVARAAEKIKLAAENQRFVGMLQEKTAQLHTRQFSLLIVDVDHFKRFNDSFGHLAGDEALLRVADVLRANSRASCVAARYGGEEFVLLVPEVDRPGALIVAERIRAGVRDSAVSDPLTGAARPLTVSIGVATFPDDATDANRLIDRADRALYAAKEAGRDRVVLATDAEHSGSENVPVKG